MSDDLWRKNLIAQRGELSQRAASCPRRFHLLIDTSMRRLLKLTDPGHSRIANAHAEVAGNAPNLHNAHVWYDLPPSDFRNAQNTWAFRSVNFDDSDHAARVRQEFFFGDWSAESMAEFNGIEATLTGICRGLPEGIRDALSLHGATGNWLWIVHRLGWLRVAGSPLIALRWMWCGGSRMEYTDADPSTFVEMQKQFNDANDPEGNWRPDRYYSVLESGTYAARVPRNVYAASVDAIDILLNSGMNRDPFFPAKWYAENTTTPPATIRKAVSGGKPIRTRPGNGKNLDYAFLDVEKLWKGLMKPDRKHPLE